MKKVRRPIIVAVTLLLLMVASSAPGQDHQFNTGSWSISSDLEKSALTIEYEHLGIVLHDVQLHIKQGDGWEKLSNWQVTEEDQRLLIHTKDPETDWVFYILNP